MKRFVLIEIIIIFSLLFTACSQQTSDKTSETAAEATSIQESNQESESINAKEDVTYMKEIALYVNGTKLDISWEDNKTVDEIKEYAKKNPITVNSTKYDNFEQVGDLPQSFTKDDLQMTTQEGDIVLYSGNKLVVFFGSNSWSYTKLGHIVGLSHDELSKLLNVNTATIEIK